MVKIQEKRRYVERRYVIAELRSVFQIPYNEMIIELRFDASTDNVLIVKTLLDFDKDKCDI